jgi:hypothetical protein
VAGPRAVAAAPGPLDEGALILRGAAESVDAGSADVETAPMAPVVKASTVDAHPDGIGGAAEPLGGLREREPDTGVSDLSGERLLDAGLYELLEAGMRGEMCRQVIEQPVRPHIVHGGLHGPAAAPSVRVPAVNEVRGS